jgi:hypothetical protein
MSPEQSAAVERLRSATTEEARSVSRTDVVNILAALDEAQQDAARFRWLCSTNGEFDLRPDITVGSTILEPNEVAAIWYGLPDDEWDLFGSAITREPGDKLRAAIDAARAGDAA